MTTKGPKLVKPGKRHAAPAVAPAPPPPPLAEVVKRGPRLDSVRSVRREMSRLYREARGKLLPIADCSRLANVLFMIGRLIEGAELEARIALLEKSRPPEC